MNRIFKTMWNVARKALVVVNEKAGIGQSRCAARGGGYPNPRNACGTAY